MKNFYKSRLTIE